MSPSILSYQAMLKKTMEEQFAAQQAELVARLAALEAGGPAPPGAGAAAARPISGTKPASARPVSGNKSPAVS